MNIRTALPKPLIVMIIMSYLLLYSHLVCSQSIRIPEGTEIVLESLARFNPELYEPGETYDFRVKYDIIVDDEIVIEQGTVVPALIRRLSAPDYIGEPGFVELSFKSVRTVDRQMIPLRNAIFRIEGKSRKKTSLLLSILFDVFLLIKGEPAYIEAGTRITLATAESAVVQIGE